MPLFQRAVRDSGITLAGLDQGENKDIMLPMIKRLGWVQSAGVTQKNICCHKLSMNLYIELCRQNLTILSNLFRAVSGPKEFSGPTT